ncbi:hypothetical protein [Kibdelosporangium phytohabitans]|nr:hypothetical protein [Kibdelosporangium phytohabitans]MBE1461112.1 hypothetical protein [Kibdelosporangium phytohabitans]
MLLGVVRHVGVPETQAAYPDYVEIKTSNGVNEVVCPNRERRGADEWS